MNVLIDENNPFLLEVLSKYNSFHLVKHYTGRELNNSDLLDNNCQILLARSTTLINQSLLKNTDLQYIATLTSGTNHVDINYLYQQKIHFASALGSNSNGVAEYVLLAVLDYTLNSTNHTDLRKFISKQKVGIIGFGNVGQKVAYYLHKLGFQILVSDPLLIQQNYIFPKFITTASLDEIVSNSTIITNHVPLTNRTQSNSPTELLLNKNNLSNAKFLNCFIHTSRGGVVCEQTLLELSHTNPSLCLYIDVWKNEPQVNQELLKISKIATPHIAGHTVNSKINAVKMILQDLETFMQKSGIKASEDFTFLQDLNLLITSKYPQNTLSVKYNFLDINFNLLSDTKFDLVISEIYNSIKTKRSLEKVFEQMKQNKSLSVVQNRDFDVMRKNYYATESVGLY